MLPSRLGRFNVGLRGRRPDVAAARGGRSGVCESVAVHRPHAMAVPMTPNEGFDPRRP